MTGRLDGKVAIVTGAGSGLGRASAVMFAAEGAAVVCADLDGSAAKATAEHIASTGGRALPFEVDVTSEDGTRAMTEAALAEYGAVDIAYACAGIAGTGSAHNTSLEDWDRVIGVNLTSKWLSVKHALAHMVERGRGSVIIQASVGGIVGVPGIFPYAAAKGGCIGMVKQMAVDYGPHGVRVNAIAPGSIPTPLVYDTYRSGGGMGRPAAADDDAVEEGLRRAAERYPLGRLGTPEENAALATYVASDESSWTTGHVFVIDGGVTVQ